MSVIGSEVAVVGGSVGGCAAAVALSHAGCRVTVFERSHGDLRDRGAGIALPLPLLDQLCEGGYLDRGMPTCRAIERVWLTREGSSALGRVMWRHPFPAVLNNWALLWGTLRSRIPEAAYRPAAPVTAVAADRAGVVVTTPQGSWRFDAVVGADGHASAVRAVLPSARRPQNASYVAWRGILPTAELTNDQLRETLEDTFVTVCFDGGHAIVYLVPGPVGSSEPVVSWVVYAAKPAGLPVQRHVPAGSVPPWAAEALYATAADQLPPAWARLVTMTGIERLAMQPVEDRAPVTYGSGRIVLVGDAASLSRPHTGSGAVKACQDALTLEQLARREDTWEELAAAYDLQRRPPGLELVRLGRAFGRLLVEETPPWRGVDEAALPRLMADAQKDLAPWCYDAPAAGAGPGQKVVSA